MSKHSPAPWTVCKPCREGNIQIENSEQMIGEAYGDDDDEVSAEETAANANLFAAAPELLAALEAAIDWIDRDSADTFEEVLVQSRAAILKATGGAS